MKNYNRVEIFGFPGSGKTTCLKRVSKIHSEFKVKQANVALNLKNIVGLIIFTFKNPGFLTLFFWLKYIPIRYYKTYLSTIIRFILRIKDVRKDLNESKKYIVDEGVLQITWSLLLLPTIFNHKFRPNDKLNLIAEKWWVKQKLLIYYIIIDDNEYLRRIKSRKRIHYFSQDFLDNKEETILKGKFLSELVYMKAINYYDIIKI